MAVGLSILAHVGLLAIPIKDPPPKLESMGAAAGPLSVVILEPEPVPKEPVAKPEPKREAPPKREPPPKSEPIRTARPETPVARDAPRLPEPPPAPVPSPLPTFDMAAMIAATRERRRAIEAAKASSREGPAPDPRDAQGENLQRNLQTLARGPGTGGIFQILRKGERTAEFAFNGWQGDARRWREVIEVDAGVGGDVELAIVRRMIALIRGHYRGDFNWESHRLGRVVVLSARPEDNEGLEEFMLREFFGVPVIKRGR